jgi:hypothetical protein
MPNRRSVIWVAVAIISLVFVAWRASVQFADPPPNAHLPADFPNAFIAPADNGKPDAIVVWRGRVAPAMINDDGIRRWPVWVCRNPACPGAAGDVPFVFAHGHDPEGLSEPTTVCPACAKALAEAKTDKSRFDPLRIEMWFTPEARAILDDVNAHLSP